MVAYIIKLINLLLRGSTVHLVLALDTLVWQGLSSPAWLSDTV